MNRADVIDQRAAAIRAERDAERETIERRGAMQLRADRRKGNR